MADRKRLPPWEQIARASQMGCVAGLEDLGEMRAAFKDDRSRYRFLERLRWPKGFVCSRCRGSHSPERPRVGMCVCAGCGHFRSVVADTLMRREQVPLARYLALFWMLASGALPLEREAIADVLGISRLLADVVLREVGLVLAHTERKPLAGIVEVDAGVLDTHDLHAIVLVAVERFHDGYGRLRMRTASSMSAGIVREFVSDVVSVGSTLRTDCWSDYLAFDSMPYLHEPTVRPPPDAGGLDGPAVALRLLRRYSKLRPPTLSSLARHLDAFCIRFNRAARDSTGELFCALLVAAFHTAETSSRNRRMISGVRRIAGLAKEPNRDEMVG